MSGTIHMHCGKVSSRISPRMTSDSKLSSFSCHFFNFAWLKLNILTPDDVTEYYGSGCLTETNLEEILDPHLLQAPLIVRYFYYHIFRNIINIDKTKYKKSTEGSCCYIHRMCNNNENWFSKLTIFERCFATISFVLTCSECTEEEFSDIKRSAHVSWLEYFDEYTEEFFEKGGWEKLRTLADSYARVFDLIHTVKPTQDSPDFFIKLSKSVENYMHFCLIRESTSKDENESKVIKGMKIEYGNEGKTCASLWIKFIVQKGNAESFDASCTPAPRSPSEVTCLLRALRNFCDPYGFRESYSKSEQKYNDIAIRSPEKIQESCIKKKIKDGKEEPHNYPKNSSFSEATGQESSRPNIKNVSLQEVEKESGDNDTRIENFTGGENDGTNNVPDTSCMAGEMWKKVKRKRNRKKAGLPFSDKSLELNKATRQAFSSSSTNIIPLQNTTFMKKRKDSVKENFAERQSDETNNMPHTSSMTGEGCEKTKRKRNRKKGKDRRKKKF